MCNACGNVCCGSDEFGGCGCDGCEDPDCWSEDEDERDDDEWRFPPELDCCSPKVGRFRCEGVDGSAV